MIDLTRNETEQTEQIHHQKSNFLIVEDVNTRKYIIPKCEIKKILTTSYHQYTEIYLIDGTVIHTLESIESLYSKL